MPRNALSVLVNHKKVLCNPRKHKFLIGEFEISCKSRASPDSQLLAWMAILTSSPSGCRDGDDIVFGSDRDNRKVRNILANPKGAVVIGGELPIEDEGYMIQGDLSIVDDLNHASVQKMLLRYETKKEAERLATEWADSDFVVIRLKPRKVIRVY